MSKSTTFITASIVLGLISMVLIALDHRMVAGLIGLPAYLCALFSVKFGAIKWKVAVGIAVAAIFGYALCPKDGWFCMLTCMLFFVSVVAVRLVFFEQLGYSKLKMIEAVLFILGVGYYVFGNIYDGSGWTSWALPTPGMAFAALMVMGKTFEDKELAAGAIEKFGVDIGKPAPDFALPDQDGNTVKLSDYKDKRHVLLVFVRGDWCPTCHIMLRSYEKNREKFAEKNIMLLALGPDDVGVNKTMMEKLGLEYKILSDARLEAAKSYGMQVHTNNSMTKYAEGIPLPASFLVDMNGDIRYTSNPKMAGEILNPETIIPVLDKLHAPALV